MNSEEFKERRWAIARMISGWLDSMNTERGVRPSESSDGKPSKDTQFFTNLSSGEAVFVCQTFAGARTTVQGTDIDPDRALEIAIGHTDDWIPVIRIASSQLDRPIEIVGGTDAAMREAIQSVHDVIFRDWPLTKHECDELIRRQLPDQLE
jgi:hypothetical protein